jgi:peptidoglycan hydrolase-like protein with peptidoglycan-binding domain
MYSKLDTIKAANPILEIQYKLRDIAQVCHDIPTVVPTGIYDAQTKKSVSEFQKKLNLPETGNVDYLTWNALMKEHRDCLHFINKPRCVGCFPNNVIEYKRGDSGNVIYILQATLKNYHNKYKNYPDVNMTGIFDEQTELALREFQKCSQLPITGVLDRKTWNILNKINETCKLFE